MTVVALVVAVLLVGFFAAAATGRLGPGMDAPTSTLASPGLPDAAEGALDPVEVDRLRLDQALRGYRMDQVDTVLDRLAAELRARDARIAELLEQSPLAHSPLTQSPLARSPLASPRAVRAPREG